MFKLTDSLGAGIGDILECYAFGSQGVINVDLYLPKLAASTYIWVFKELDNNYYLIQPTLMLIGEAANDVEATADTVGGRMIYNWFGKYP